MSMAEVGLPGQRIDVLNGGDVAPDGRLLSVAEIQRAFRELTALRSGQATALREHTPAIATRTGPPWQVDRTVPDMGKYVIPARQPDTSDEAGLRPGWVSVLAAHSGAGASTVALAIADAAAQVGRAVHLIETAHPTRSGLVAAASAELGADPDGAWRRGSRGTVIIDRRAGDCTPTGWPAGLPDPADAAEAPLVLVDVGLPSPANRGRVADSHTRVVVVCRPTVPGARLVEQLLAALAGQQVIVAAVGPCKWPGEVACGAGPLLRAARADDRLVGVPPDRRLEVTGPINSPLPKSVTAAGRVLLGLLDAAFPGDAPTAASHRAPATEGTPQ